MNARGEVVSRHRFYPKWPIDSARNAENYAGTWIRQVYQPCSVVRRSVFERIGGFDASYRIAGDAEFFIRAREAGVRFRYLPGSPWVRMRDDGLSSRRHWQAELETLRAFRRHDPSRWRPYAQFVRARMVAFCEVRAPRALDLARRALGSPRSAGAAATDNAGREPLGCG
ncbi:MAG: hypothetical protein D6731_12820 [Planctomycetota bacterium]|nr:MAG: hypothetical protein D6731_12820 [Planctomycetota bacterium]